ncbi:protein translocase subunit SecD [Catenulispora sp. NF23]|uniref:Protein translocase subunit SecD n=1 Tax=Catenulispora pinistramenti TaxID=2705254 RepID=A0ABS5KMH2_9ACTN|nr:protein translocase subunit SecD [Catenulispora pinistramenti]MBS2534548.1 protein translocase subunit SecD [Catenulispora pinistramenti]MBS2547258.1 protein translocase subunit SecD [Catenulispora pinistramenti]
MLAAVIMALVGTMIGTGHKTPQLGIDLAGGTTMTMTAQGSKAPATGDMDTALQIMRNRVNGQGVSEAEVTKQGNNAIEVDLPGKNSSELLKQLGQTAKLYFRVVVADPTQYGIPARSTVAPPTATPSSPTPSPSGATTPSGSAGSKESSPPSSKSSGSSATTPSSSKASTPSTPSGTSSSTQHRVADQGLKDSDVASSDTPSGSSTGSTASSKSSATASGSKSAASTPSTPASNPSSPAPSPSASPSAPATAPDGTVKESTPNATALNLYETIDCTKPPTTLGSMFAANQFSVGCDFTSHEPYLLEPADVDGKDLSSASANAVTAGGSNAFLTGQWEVDLSFNSKGAADFGRVTTELNGNGGQFAVDLDGTVYSAATVQQPITDGNARITGTFTQKQAQDLANVLKYGSLPITFDQGNVSQISASLAGNQLAAGLVAGGIGMVLVILYLIAYYRGLSIVAVSSLVISAILTYSLVSLLGSAISFRLSLAGVAGLVVAIGITADSFVIFFERLRDEVREGRTLRTAVDHGWVRARRTIISSDFVSFLAAFVLYEVSVGTVKGFAFTLGLTTLLDIVVVFTFTKPIVTLLARRKFFNDGHPWSGLDPNRLGVKKSPGIRQTIVDRRAAARRGSAEGMEA